MTAYTLKTNCSPLPRDFRNKRDIIIPYGVTECVFGVESSDSEGEWKYFIEIFHVEFRSAFERWWWEGAAKKVDGNVAPFSGGGGLE